MILSISQAWQFFFAHDFTTEWSDFAKCGAGQTISAPVASKHVHEEGWPDSVAFMFSLPDPFDSSLLVYQNDKELWELLQNLLVLMTKIRQAIASITKDTREKKF